MTRTSFFNSLSGRLLLLGVLPAMLAIGLIVALGAIDSYHHLRKSEERVMAADASGAAGLLSTRNDRWNNVAALLANTQAHGMFGQRKSTLEIANSVLSTFKGIIGSYLIYEPNADGQDAASLKAGDLPKEALDPSGRFLPCWYTDTDSTGDGSGIKIKPNTQMDTLEYYQGPKGSFAKTGKPEATLTEPYEYEGVLMVSHTFPIVIDGRFKGIAGIDRSLTRIMDIAEQIKARSSADVLILSAGGRFLASTTADAASLRMRPLADSPYASLDSRLRTVRSGGEVDVFDADDPVLGEPCIYAAERTEFGDWCVVIRRPKSAVLHQANVSVTRNVMVGALLMLIGGGIMLFMARSISRRVSVAAHAADRIAHGDLSQQVQESRSRDETGQLMRSMGTMDRNLNALVGSVKQSSIHLNSTATEIAATSKQQEGSASTFGAASSQIAAAVKEISATGQDLVRTMESVNAMAVETADLATAGHAGLQGMESVMRDLDRATTSIAEKLGAINERSQKITTVITTITKVADQTNILSINAAIEAEKAGEYGSGFLVIAREIRRLADQTASATLDIEQMVQQMQTAVSAGVMEMDRFSDQVRRGVRDVAAAGNQLTKIIDRVNRSTESFKQVNESMQAQAEGAQQISDAMGSLVGNANQTMQSVREFGRAATDLQAAIATLRQAVAQFKLRE